jgi:lipoprotein-releasing system ATP-binding protein
MTVRPILDAQSVSKCYRGTGVAVDVLREVSLAVEEGQVVCIVGASGVGKSTLLHILGSLDRPDAGSVTIRGDDIHALAGAALDRLRNATLGFVFQFHFLLPDFTALENVMMPALLSGASFDVARGRARELLAEVGLDHRESHKPRQLSGGEQQRVAVARALVNEPLVLLADEPSGNLDTHSSERLHDLLFGLRAKRRLSLVVVTHNADLAHRADRILRMQDGRLQPAPRV